MYLFFLLSFFPIRLHESDNGKWQQWATPAGSICETVPNGLYARSTGTFGEGILQGKLRFKASTLWTCCPAQPARVDNQGKPDDSSSHRVSLNVFITKKISRTFELTCDKYPDRNQCKRTPKCIQQKSERKIHVASVFVSVDLCSHKKVCKSFPLVLFPLTNRCLFV